MLLYHLRKSLKKILNNSDLKQIETYFSAKLTSTWLSKALMVTAHRYESCSTVHGLNLKVEYENICVSGRKRKGNEGKKAKGTCALFKRRFPDIATGPFSLIPCGLHSVKWPLLIAEKAGKSSPIWMVICAVNCQRLCHHRKGEGILEDDRKSLF